MKCTHISDCPSVEAKFFIGHSAWKCPCASIQKHNGNKCFCRCIACRTVSKCALHQLFAKESHTIARSGTCNCTICEAEKSSTSKRIEQIKALSLLCDLSIAPNCPATQPRLAARDAPKNPNKVYVHRANLMTLLRFKYHRCCYSCFVEHYRRDKEEKGIKCSEGRCEIRVSWGVYVLPHFRSLKPHLISPLLASVTPIESRFIGRKILVCDGVWMGKREEFIR